MEKLKHVWSFLGKASIVIGNFISTVVLFFFYFTVFAAIAIPFRLLNKPFLKVSAGSNWRIKKLQTPQSLGDFKNE